MSLEFIGITLRCIKGEEWPTNTYKLLVRFTDDPITDESITILCPSLHEYTLKRAVQGKLIPERYVPQILENARNATPPEVPPLP